MRRAPAGVFIAATDGAVIYRKSHLCGGFFVGGIGVNSGEVFVVASGSEGFWPNRFSVFGGAGFGGYIRFCRRHELRFRSYSGSLL
jgi:hypothetical protein